MELILKAVEKGLVPDGLVRVGIRHLLRERLQQETHDTGVRQKRALRQMVRKMEASPIAVGTREANEQHYEVPACFFFRILGPRLKYSCCYWEREDSSLAEAEESMLALTCERAGLRDGQDILELGCGWGSLTLWMAERYPSSRIVAVSNSASQGDLIRGACRERGFQNVEVQTADMNAFDADRTFDRVVSVEMFEHMRNYKRLLGRISRWLAPGGRLFVHVFCHKELAYFFETDGQNDWMARHFFTGGLMPSRDFFDHFAEDFEVEEDWSINGMQYARTLLAWLERLDAQRKEVHSLFEEVYGAADAGVWVSRWRLFLLACAELFAYRNGEEWFVTHQLLKPRAGRAG